MLLKKEDLFIHLKIIRAWNTVTHWKVISLLTFLLLLLPIFKEVLPFIFPLLYVNEVVTINPFLSFITLILMINFSYWLFYLMDYFIKNYFLFNPKLLKALYTIGFLYYLVYMLLALYRLLIEGYQLV